MEKSVHTAEYAGLLKELRAMREAAGLSQRSLAVLLEVPHSWVAKVETGERRIDVVEFRRFAAACDADAIAAFRRIVENSPRAKRAGRARRPS